MEAPCRHFSEAALLKVGASAAPQDRVLDSVLLLSLGSGDAIDNGVPGLPDLSQIPPFSLIPFLGHVYLPPSLFLSNSL